MVVLDLLENLAALDRLDLPDQLDKMEVLDPV